MILFRKWLPSVLLIGGSAIFLLMMLRRLGPAGPGVPFMLEMQSAWQSPPAIRASGVIKHNIGGRATISRFVYEEANGSDRRADITDSTGTTTTTVVAPPRAWSWEVAREHAPGRRAAACNADRDLLFPLPDPDCGNSFYRWARHWSAPTTLLINGVPCQELVGTTPDARLIFDLDARSHLPRRVLIEQGRGQGEVRWSVQFTTIEAVRRLAPGLFKPPAGISGGK